MNDDVEVLIDVDALDAELASVEDELTEALDKIASISSMLASIRRKLHGEEQP